jgi:hypothetical protein
MLRKLALVVLAAASLGAAALAPTSASAWGGWHRGWGWGGPRFYVGGRSIMVTAAAMCGDWCRRRGGRAGAW